MNARLKLFAKRILWDTYVQGRYEIGKVTKTQLITKPINDAGYKLRFKRPTGKITPGMQLVPIPYERFSPTTYYLEIVEATK